MNRFHRFLGVAGVIALCCGCGGGGIDKFDLVDVKGKVFVDDQPHGPAVLTLYPTSVGEEKTRPSPTGSVAADGTFTLTTYEPGDGAPPGEYTINLQAASSLEGDASVDPNAMMGAMGGASYEPVTVTIPEGGSESLELRFKSGKKKQGGGTLLGS